MKAPAHLGPFPTHNALWAALWVEELVRSGVGLFVVAPGSRSTPLALALASNAGAEVRVHWDERAAAFLALGWGRATGRPAAVVTTSGTAVANLLPAAAEADAAGVPLLLLTADRPWELREAGANQTLRQPPLLDGVTRWSFAVDPPSPDVDPAAVLTTAAQAVARALAPAGPVHLNLAFREPLAPPADAPLALALPPHLEAWAASGRPYTTTLGVPRASMPVGAAAVEPALGAERGLVVLGQTDDPAAAPAALRLADALGWPLWADLLGGARLGHASAGAVVAHGDAVLADADRAAALRPDAVVFLGARAVSKRLQQALVRWAPRDLVVVHSSAGRLDPDHRVTARLEADVAAGADALRALAPGRAPGPYRGAWRAADAAAGAALAAGIAASGLSEPFVARAVTELVPDGWALVAAASMPVRDLDAFAAADGAAVWATANRGASGIDGTVATAAGVAAGRGAPAVLLAGDLALLHDLTSLALLREGPPVVVVAVNNDGGGIFHQLPVAASAPEAAFERFFGTPHGLGFRAAAAWAGLDYAAPETQAGFRQAVERAVRSGTSWLVEVRTDREAQTALRRALRAAA